VKRDLAELTAREHDLVVIGGGIHGVAVAHDAAQRGLSVALVEAADFGGGTSWNSLKTVHGGLRHLQRADVPGLRESARERAALLRIAPGLVRPLAFLVPTYRGRGPSRTALGAALRLDGWLGPRVGASPGERAVPSGRLLSVREVLDRLPALAAEGLTGGAEWTDAQISSTERLLLAFLHAAAGAGATVANYVEATAVERSGVRVRGISARDVLGGDALGVRGRVVINATGPGLDAVLARAGLTRRAVPLLHAANLVLGRDVVKTRAVGAKSGGRFLFLVPWQERSIVGTAYAAGARPPVAAEFLDEARRAFPWAGLQPADLRLVHRGRVPGSGGAEGLRVRSRLVDHGREDGLAGLLSLLTVKYTTARALAEKAVDAALLLLARRAPPCRTAVTSLPRAAPLQGPLADQARQAVRDEAAVHLDDAVLRRLDLASSGRPPAAAVDQVAGAMAADLGWTTERLRAERDRLEGALREAEAR
jgi:glycerol-3-phosphate dehydrogenase